MKVSLSIVLGGAISNITERVLRGRVIDFLAIQISNRPFTFNIADIFLAIGILISMYFLYTEHRKDKAYEVGK